MGIDMYIYIYGKYYSFRIDKKCQRRSYEVRKENKLEFILDSGM